MLPAAIVLALAALSSVCVSAQPASGRSALNNIGVSFGSKHHHAHVKKTKVKKRTLVKKSQTCILHPKGSGNHTVPTNTTSGISPPVDGVITVQDAKCGPNGATKNTTQTTGPNGSITFLNCGISKEDPDSGWTPPVITILEMVYMDLDEALKDPNSPYIACSQYVSLFKSIAANTTVNGVPLPAIMLAAFASQESSCNPNESGGGGEVGMFQLSEDKCPGGKSSSACFDVTYNTQTAANYIAGQIMAANGSIPLMVGRYNGWDIGMSFNSATAAATGSCCRCQNNLDYLIQWFAWLQNINAYAVTIGMYFNLNSCPNSGANGRRGLGSGLPLRRDRPKGLWSF